MKKNLLVVLLIVVIFFLPAITGVAGARGIPGWSFGMIRSERYVPPDPEDPYVEYGFDDIASSYMQFVTLDEPEEEDEPGICGAGREGRP